MRKYKGGPIFGAAFLLVLLAFCATGLALIARFRAEDTAGAFYAGIGRLVAASPDAPIRTLQPTATAAPALPEQCRRVAELQAEYPEVMGWVEIPDTPLSYPVLQGTDNAYYLDRLPDGTENPVGSIFLDCRCKLDEGDLILYGHNVHRGTMFGSLRSYRDAGYLEKHPAVWFYTAEAAYECPIFAAQEADAYDTTVYDPESDGGARILTLSTCTGTRRETRFVVRAYLEKSDRGPQ